MEGREQDYRRAHEEIVLEPWVREQIRQRVLAENKKSDISDMGPGEGERKMRGHHSFGKNRRGWLYAGVLACLAAVTALAVFVSSSLTGGDIRVLAAAEYPEALAFDDYEGKRALAESLGPVSEEFRLAVRQFAADSARLVLGQETEENLCYSPLSLYTALGMVAETAAGETKDEILACLHYEGDSLAEEMYRYLRLCYQENGISVIKPANSLWFDSQAVEESMFREDTVERLAQSYMAESCLCDFERGDTQKAMAQWVAKQTKGLLGTEPSDFAQAPENVMSLLSTLYYYDQWMNAFNKDNNIEGTFTRADGSQVTAEYMRTTKNPYAVLAAEGYTAASLHMKGDSKITFVLPDEGRTPADILADEAAMSRLLWITEEPEMEYAEVRFSIPKYSFRSSLDLTPVAEALGIRRAFSLEEADFGGIVSAAEGPVWLGGIRQQISMSIDEKGCEAAAFTQIDYIGAALPEDRIVEFCLNRPFLIIVSSGEPLFIGVINQP